MADLHGSSSSSAAPRPRSRGPCNNHEEAASPPHARTLAGDLRRLASNLQESPNDTLNSSASVTPQATSSRAGASSAGRRTASTGHLPSRELAMLVSQLKEQRDADQRRIKQMERRLEQQLDSRVHGSDASGNERWAETQGKVQGLLEDMQSLRQRVEALDARLWARTGGSEGESTEKRLGDLGSQLQALEHQNRLAASSLEESQRRQVSKLRRTEQHVEDLLERVSVMEQEVRASASGASRSTPKDAGQESRLRKLELHKEYSDAAVRSLKEKVEQGLQAASAAVEAVEASQSKRDRDDSEDERRSSSRDLVAALEWKTSGQIQELSSALASMRVKADGQLQRLNTIAERLETAHEPALTSLRSMLEMTRTQDQQRWEAEVQSMRSKLEELGNSSEDANADVREALRKAFTEIASLRPLHDRLDDVEGQLGSLVRQGTLVSPQRADRLHRPLQLEAQSGFSHDYQQGQVGAMQVDLVTGSAYQAQDFCAAGHAVDDRASTSSGSSISSRQYGGPAMQPDGHVHEDIDEVGFEDSWEAAENQQLQSNVSEKLVADLEVVASHLHAADGLADRVAELEQVLVASNVAEGVSADASPSDAAGPLPARLFRLSQDVSELQARLLQSQLSLHTEGHLVPEAADDQDAQPSDDFGDSSAAVAAEQLQVLALQVRDLEEALTQELACRDNNAKGPSEAAIELEDGDEMSQGPVDVLDGSDGDLLISDHCLLMLAERLEPLELAFRTLSERLGTLCEEGRLAPEEAGAADGSDGKLAQLFAKVEQLQPDPVLEERFTAIDRRLASVEEMRPRAHAQDDEVFRSLAQRVWSCQEKELAEVKDQVEETRRAVKTLRSDVDQLQMISARRVAETPASRDDGTSPLQVARGRLDHLCTQMAELQSRMKDGSGKNQGRSVALNLQERLEHLQHTDGIQVGPGPRSAGSAGMVDSPASSGNQSF
eukprot:TRINITY_DN62308_c0_g1_i1.p1 TRINITY_DN62308_c0_g1~~TRINITY_DN62308_c0_g1_i1.p1  ORF type:complete len:959 (+),score=277.16 TRINITY_DN62308_c0_g1_i1:26-2878(+)